MRPGSNPALSTTSNRNTGDRYVLDIFQMAPQRHHRKIQLWNILKTNKLLSSTNKFQGEKNKEKS